MIKLIVKAMLVLGSAVMISACVEETYYHHDAPPHHYHHNNVTHVSAPSNSGYSSSQSNMPVQPQNDGYSSSAAPGVTQSSSHH